MAISAAARQRLVTGLWGGVLAGSFVGRSPVIAAVEETAVVTPPVDFVISPPYYMHQIQAYKKAAAKHEATEQDEREVLEMIQIYATATKAMRMQHVS